MSDWVLRRLPPASEARGVSRWVPREIAKADIKSQGGIKLPTELWLKVFSYLTIGKPEYCLAQPLDAATHEGVKTVTCAVNLTSLNISVAELDSADEVGRVEKFLISPDAGHELELQTADKPVSKPQRNIHNAPFFTITLADERSKDHDTNVLQEALQPDCLFQDLDVPDIIAHLQNEVCWVCEFQKEHRICPGCKGGVAQQFDISMGCGVLLACPLCLGMGFMLEDKELLEKYHWDSIPREEWEAREERFNVRYQELGYFEARIEDYESYIGIQQFQ